jgi:hypothetical protein
MFDNEVESVTSDNPLPYDIRFEPSPAGRDIRADQTYLLHEKTPPGRLEPVVLAHVLKDAQADIERLQTSSGRPTRGMTSAYSQLGRV